MKKKYYLIASCLYLSTITVFPAFSNFSSTAMNKCNPYAVISGTAMTTLMLDANGGEFDDGTTLKTYEPDTEDSLVLYSNGGEFSDGTTMKTYKENTLTLDAGIGTFENGASTKKYEISDDTDIDTDDTDTEESKEVCP